jgi:hypothetical protein
LPLLLFIQRYGKQAKEMEKHLPWSKEMEMFMSFASKKMSELIAWHFIYGIYLRLQTN